MKLSVGVSGDVDRLLISRRVPCTTRSSFLDASLDTSSPVSRWLRESFPVPTVAHKRGPPHRVFRRTRPATSGRCWSQQQVEAAGIEPATRNSSTKASTCVVDCLISLLYSPVH